jgi:hypothetical protein
VIKSVSGSTVRNFYGRFYAPQNLAFVAVGDFEDLDAVVQLFERHFGSAVKSARAERDDPGFLRGALSESLVLVWCGSGPSVVPLPPPPPVPSHPKARIGIFSDPEVRGGEALIDAASSPESDPCMPRYHR